MNTVRGVGVDVERTEPGVMGRVSVGQFWRFSKASAALRRNIASICT